MKPTIIALILSGLLGTTAFAQLGNAAIGASGNFGNVTNVGRLRGARSLNWSTPASTGTPGGGRSANRVDTSSVRGEFSGRRTSTSVRGFGTSQLDNRTRAGSLIMYFGRSPSAQFFANRAYDGRGANFRPLIPSFTTKSTLDIIRPQKELPLLRSFHHRAVLPREGGAIRDELTNTSLRNTAPIPESASYENKQGESHATMLARSIKAKYDRYVSDGWELLGTKELRTEDYMRGRIYFENAMTIEPNKLEARIGKLLCSLVGGQYATAGADLHAALAKDDPILSVQVRSDQVFSDPETSRKFIRELARLVQEEPDAPFLAALYAYALWFDGQDVAAISAANKIRADFRATPYAKLADQIINGPPKVDESQKTALFEG